MEKKYDNGIEFSLLIKIEEGREFIAKFDDFDDCDVDDVFDKTKAVSYRIIGSGITDAKTELTGRDSRTLLPISLKCSTARAINSFYGGMSDIQKQYSLIFLNRYVIPELLELGKIEFKDKFRDISKNFGGIVKS